MYQQWEKNSFEMTFHIFGYLAQGALHRDHANRKRSNLSTTQVLSQEIIRNDITLIACFLKLVDFNAMMVSQYRCILQNTIHVIAYHSIDQPSIRLYT